MPADPALIVTGDFHRPTGFAGAQALLDLPIRPSAILASNDEMAFGAMEAARVNGLRIPNDISMVGFDDIPGVRSSTPR